MSKIPLQLDDLTEADEQTLSELALTIFDIYLAQKQRESSQANITMKDRDLSAVGLEK